VSVSSVSCLRFSFLKPFPVDEMVAFCDAATFGRGDETLVDDSVRKAWQLPRDRFSFSFGAHTNTIQNLSPFRLMPHPALHESLLLDK
jgi:hypothetical protein